MGSEYLVILEEAAVAGGATSVVFGAVAVVGLLLCIFGRKLVKPVMCIIGLAAGGVLACAGAYGRVEQPVLLGLVAAGALVGVLLAWLLFRIWMGVGLAIVMATLVPMAAMGMEEKMPTLPRFGEQMLIDLRKSMDADTEEERAPSVVREHARKLIDEQFQPVRDWWDNPDAKGRSLLTVGSIAGALIGLFIGLVGPRVTASILSSLIGSSLLLGGLERMGIAGIQSRLPQTDNGLLITVGLITLAVVIVQWTIFRRKADK